MLDFTSSLYLGFRHGAGSLRPWSQLTTGKPAVLAEPPGSSSVARQLAALQGCQHSVLGTSTLHLAWDLFGMLAGESVMIFMDASTYPIAQWGVERAAAQGVPVRAFPHQDADALGRMLRQSVGRRRPVVVSDSLCTSCGCSAPIADYLDVARRTDGLLVIDDTQALGILGARPSADAPYGHGGGGSLRYSNVGGPDIVLISSLAKAFGAPVAALSGSKAVIQQFIARSETRMHCSPPSAAAIHAAARALHLNTHIGNLQRRLLAQRVRYFQARLAEIGLSAAGGLFPVQTLVGISGAAARRMYERLLHSGIQGVLRRGCDSGGPHLSLIITTHHRPDEIARTVSAIALATGMGLHHKFRSALV